MTFARKSASAVTLIPPSRRHRRGSRQRHAAWLLGTVIVALSACGGGGDIDPSPAAEATTISAEKSAATTPTPLFDELGRALPTPREAQPADTAVRTRTGLYATRAQLEWEELTVGIYTIVLDVDALGSAEATVGKAHQLRGWNDGSARAYYVRANNLAAGVEVVRALEDAGFGLVFLVH